MYLSTLCRSDRHSIASTVWSCLSFPKVVICGKPQLPGSRTIPGSQTPPLQCSGGWAGMDHRPGVSMHFWFMIFSTREVSLGTESPWLITELTADSELVLQKLNSWPWAEGNCYQENGEKKNTRQAITTDVRQHSEFLLCRVIYSLVPWQGERSSCTKVAPPWMLPL